MKILITGNLGYIGPIVARHLRYVRADARLLGFDNAYFALSTTGASILPERILDEQHFGDVREIPDKLLEGVDAVVHLAAVSNDPMGHQFEQVTADVNHRASIDLAEKARAAGVSHFVFASSCSVYGFAPGAPRTETDDINPQTAYARSKVAVEKELGALSSDRMIVTCLRFATACGMSDRLRLDLVLNDFVACALALGTITVLSDGSPWRPLIDVRDMARAIEWAATRKVDEGGAFLSVNVGSNDRNYQVRDLAAAVAEVIPGTSVSINRAAQPDNRSYQVDFSLFASLAKAHQPQVTLRQSIEMLAAGLRRMNFADPDFRNSPFIRLKMLEAHIAAGRLTRDLRWLPRASEEAA
ncbi:SDR family oxidoreductase [Mesorhizobium sp. VK24D]|uniref:SDR family oxidoreductase n=1 Tax=Mesorhizobium album TaxID=3072314 RepID=A0ABU4YA10_9HYPH|nr:SDR family oxidoreductase [Mesorhizobium sp. VK24D]MDX8482945.1 SDR family oxidoreductase [Mesorhizobium sp. VK24D]